MVQASPNLTLTENAADRNPSRGMLRHAENEPGHDATAASGVRTGVGVAVSEDLPVSDFAGGT